MESNSDEELGISDSEVEEYARNPYQALRIGALKVWSIEGTLRCPFCVGKEEYAVKDLHRHASGIAIFAAHRSTKQIAHLALARYLEVDLGFGSVLPSQLAEPETESAEPEEVFCWPWTGIVVNIVKGGNSGKQFADSGFWMKTFSKYQPLEVQVFHNELEETADLILQFDKRMTGYKNGLDFEKAFEAVCRSKKDWIVNKADVGSDVYGWLACADDYHTEGQIGNYLRKNTELNTFSDIVQKGNQSSATIVVNLANEISMKNQSLMKMQSMFNQKNMALNRIVEEKDDLQAAFNGIQKIQKMAEAAERVLQEQLKMMNELEAKRKEVYQRSWDISKHEALTERELQKLIEEKHQVI